MRNIKIHQCTQMLMIKTFPGGTGATGYVKDSVFENFWAYDSTYGLGIFFPFPPLPYVHALTNIRYRSILGIPHNARHRRRCSERFDFQELDGHREQRRLSGTHRNPRFQHRPSD